MSTDTVIGIDVGTGSARAGVFTAKGELLGRAVHPFSLHRPRQDFVEQSGNEIWEAVCAAVRGAIEDAGIDPSAVRALAVDAASSTVVRDVDGGPLCVSPDGKGDRDTIVWMDHRAKAEAQEATATGAAPLAFVGGTMSPEMATPKLAWLKRNHPDRWARTGFAFDLADYVSWRASGRTERSACTLTCKWTYLADSHPHWDTGYLDAMGLEDLLERASLPEAALSIGAPIGPVTEAAAAALGLTTECIVAAGLVDAHAGALGTLAPYLGEGIDRHMALIAGTSNCQMALSPTPISVPGVWGPYKDAVAPGTYLNEGGQSAAGSLLDHIIERSPASAGLGENPHDDLAKILAPLMAETPDLAPHLHVLPDFHGNRSPHADPEARGAITGLDFSDPMDALVRTYWATAAAIAYETREIVAAMNAQGYRITAAHLSGGAARNPVLSQIYADATGLTVTRPASADPVILGAAIAASVAGGLHKDIETAARAMVAEPEAIASPAAAKAAHDARYDRYLAFADFQRAFHKSIRGAAG
ncbi:MAG: FGGY-family carbohydrate kinase [Pseudomonadota bacterium]